MLIDEVNSFTIYSKLGTGKIFKIIIGCKSSYIKKLFEEELGNDFDICRTRVWKILPINSYLITTGLGGYGQGIFGFQKNQSEYNSYYGQHKSVDSLHKSNSDLTISASQNHSFRNKSLENEEEEAVNLNSSNEKSNNKVEDDNESKDDQDHNGDDENDEGSYNENADEDNDDGKNKNSLSGSGNDADDKKEAGEKEEDLEKHEAEEKNNSPNSPDIKENVQENDADVISGMNIEKSRTNESDVSNESSKSDERKSSFNGSDYSEESYRKSSFYGSRSGRYSNYPQIKFDYEDYCEKCNKIDNKSKENEKKK